MAIALASKAGVNIADPDFPLGKIVDGVGTGTPITSLSHQDYHQFFARMLEVAGVTANGNLDNATNGYQYIEVLQKLMGYEAWTAGTAPTVAVANGGGSVSIGTTNYNSYQIIGKTLRWNCSFDATVSGTVTSFTITRPATAVGAYATTSFRYPMSIAGTSGIVGTLSLTGFSGPGQVTIGKADNTALPTGTFGFAFSITAELA